MIRSLGIGRVIIAIKSLVKFFIENHLVFLLLTIMCLTIDYGIKHAEKVTFDQGHVANDALEAIDVI